MLVKSTKLIYVNAMAAFGLSSKMIICDVVVIKTIFKSEHQKTFRAIPYRVCEVFTKKHGKKTKRTDWTSIIEAKAGRAQMRSICLRLAKCRHDTLIQSKRKQQIAIFLQLYVTIRVTSALFIIRSRHFPSMKLRDCSKILVFFKLAHLLLHLNAI